MEKYLIYICIFSIFLMPQSFAQEDYQEDYQDKSVVQLDGFLQYNHLNDEENENNAVYLDLEEKKHINYKDPYSYSFDTSKFNKSADLSIFDSKIEMASKFSSQEYMISPVSQYVYKKTGKIIYGAAYSSYLDSAEINYQTGLFTKYDAKRFSITAAISTNANNDYSEYRDKIYVIPELKITKRLSLIDVVQSDTDRLNSKNEILLRYVPKFRQDNNLQFEMGLGQSFYNNEQTKSSVKFSTKVRL